MSANGWTNVNRRQRLLPTHKVVSESKAAELERHLNIDGLRDAFASARWIRLQQNGWKFDMVIRAQDPQNIPSDTNSVFTTPVGNGWGDTAVFRRR